MSIAITSALVLVACWLGADAIIEEIPMPPRMKACFDRAKEKGDLTVQIGEKVVWHCIHGSLWSLAKEKGNREMPPAAMKWFADLIHKSYREAEVRSRQRRQAVNGARNRNRRQLRVRKEYRMMSDEERNNFHRAMQMLKVDRSIPPNRFDALGLMHEFLGERSHDGPNFLLWHRLFLVVAENALREKVPSVTIPYWDSTLDGGLDDPRASIIWSPAFMGNGNGRIRSGPFRNWRTPYGPLMRNFGDGGTMMNWTSLRDTFSKSHIEEISNPNGDPRSNLEDHHGEPHLWVGGYMAPVALAGYDPVFFLHHSFIDLLWELFRRIQRRKGVDPTRDYPTNFSGPPGHRHNDPSGFGALLNRHALSDIFTTEMYTYQLPPTCSRARPTCGSRYINCVNKFGRPRCVSASVFDTPPNEVFDVNTLQRKKRNASWNRTRIMSNNSQVSEYIKQIQTAAELKCMPENVNEQYVNNYLLDGVADIDGWSYIPVNVIVRRKPYSMASSSTRRAAIYDKCDAGAQLPFRVFIESSGISYQGFYKEIAHIKESVSTSSTVSYIGVKTPANTSIEAAISAYDSCGRICRPFCKSSHRNHYRACQGTVRVRPGLPRQYSASISDMSDLLWRDNEFGLPSMDNNELFIKFVCDESVTWPWTQ